MRYTVSECSCDESGCICEEVGKFRSLREAMSEVRRIVMRGMCAEVLIDPRG